MEMKHKILSGDERFTYCGDPLPENVKDFWAWSMSRLIADGPRGDLAEFIVNMSLGMDMTNPKKGWGAYDIEYYYKGNKIRIEVKCSSMLQAWNRKTPSSPVFSIAPTLNCEVTETDDGYEYIGRDDTPPCRRSDLYVFCLFAEEDRSKALPLNLSQWQFYVVPTNVLNEKLGSQRRITIQGLNRIGFEQISYDLLKQSIDNLAQDIVNLQK